MHEPVGAALAGDVRAEPALHRHEAEDEQGVITSALRLGQHRLRELRSQLRLETAGDALQQRFHLGLANLARERIAERFREDGDRPRDEEQDRSRDRQGDPAAHGDDRSHLGASSGHAPPAGKPRQNRQDVEG